MDHTREKITAHNRSRVIQLENELHNISMKNQIMSQYLTSIKSHVDNISVAGSQIDHEDIILYILNGLPSSYQAFKTSIRTKLTPIGLDDLYPLLCSEKININNEHSKELKPADLSHTLFSNEG